MSKTYTNLAFNLAGLMAINLCACGASGSRESGPIIIDQAPPELHGVMPRFWSAAFSPDGTTLAVTGGWDNPREPGQLVLWDVSTRREKLIFRQAATIRTVAFARDSKMLAIGDFDGNVRLLDAASGKVLATPPPHASIVNSVAFTPDGKRLAAGSFDRSVSLWDVAAGEEQPTLQARDQVTKIAISPDGRYLAAGFSHGQVTVWNLAKRAELYSVPASLGTSTAEAIAFGPDSKTLVTGCWDGSLKLWNSVTGELIRELHSDPRVFDAVFTPDGRTLATAGGSGLVTLWDPETGKRLADIRAHSERCWSVTCSPDGKQLATASWDRSAKLWNLNTRVEIASFTLQP